jgi:hypothetical protein
MNEQTIFQNVSMLVFNAMQRGVDRETAMKDAEETMRQMIQLSKKLALTTTDDSAGTVK